VTCSEDFSTTDMNFRPSNVAAAQYMLALSLSGSFPSFFNLVIRYADVIVPFQLISPSDQLGSCPAAVA
jgi:hypothetical protein